MTQLELREVAYSHADALRLTVEVQQMYVQRYGGPDESQIDASQFVGPNGLFVVGYSDEQPVAMAGWRLRPPDDPHTSWATPVAEIKRMYVTASQRGTGVARQLLAFLERTAVERGARWLVLETGSKQPEAIALYRSSGYQDVPAFGHYAGSELSVHLGKQVG